MFFENIWKYNIKTTLRFFFLLIYVLLIGCEEKNLMISTTKDTINVINSGSGKSIGLLVDGQNSNSFVNDKKFLSANTIINVGKLKRSTKTNEVVGFTEDRPPKYLSTPWTTGSDSFNLIFPDKIQIPVTVWIVIPEFDQQYIADMRDHTLQIWQHENMGVVFSQFNIIDASDPTKYPKAHFHLAFGRAFKNVSDIELQKLREDIDFIPGQINIYLVNTVKGDTARGFSNFHDQIVMGSNAPLELLAHEIGHAFSLEHISQATISQNQVQEYEKYFKNDENIMKNSGESGKRQFFTEGQLFRAHMNPKSALNALYEARVGELPIPERSCCTDTGCALTVTNTCPAIQKRIWADGPCLQNNNTCLPN